MDENISKQFELELDKITEQLDKKLSTYILSVLNDTKSTPEAHVSGTTDPYNAIYLISSAVKALLMSPQVEEDKPVIGKILLLSVLKILNEELGHEGVVKMYGEIKEEV